MRRRHMLRLARSRQYELFDLFDLGVDRSGERIHRLHKSHLPSLNVVNSLWQGSLNRVDASHSIVGFPLVCQQISL